MQRTGYLLLFIASLVMSLKCFSEQGYSLNLNGKWKVEHVYVDEDVASAKLITLIPDDPNLKGRIFEFTSDKIKTSIQPDSGCEFPDYHSMNVTILNHLMSSTTEGVQYDPAKSYSLPVKGTLNIHPYSIHCQNGKISPSDEHIEHWLVKLNVNLVLLNWDNQSYILLKKLSDNARFSPSFACERATNDSEKTICHDPDLSSWDVSVAEAYNIVLKQITNTGLDAKIRLAQFHQNQKHWLDARNACSANSTCIKKKMQARVAELIELAKS
ncbi:hypothetical protein GC090_08115 [Pantoea sp. JZ29]|uniref:lysozyme inhibitor LprI family protein n=1 Tax=Pantoea sp. JZ29 TaxID=2654192 RepID=UPI002B49CF9C|nr:lysozyme inhibitor LprI family protein [Pantoea sp. JZ29]WRH20637.1 hypothetical protein GC090_08115 [Pantoea sp. JZ29]